MKRQRSVGVRCPTCKRILIPTRKGQFPPHFGNPDTKRWCKRTDEAIPTPAKLVHDPEPAEEVSGRLWPRR